jgi:hypothetical protein
MSQSPSASSPLPCQPLARLVHDLRLQAARSFEPCAQEFDALWGGQSEKEMVRRFQYGLGSRQGRIRIDEICGRIDDTADFARIGVLVLRVTVGAFALDVSVGQEHALDRVIELLDRLYVDQTGLLQSRVHVLGECDVLRGVGRVPVIEADVKAAQILRPIRRDAPDELLRANTLLFGLEHDGCSVRVIGGYEMHLVPQHPLEAHPDIRLDVLHDVPDVKRAIGVGQSGSNEKLAGHPRSLPPVAAGLGTGRRARQLAHPRSFTASNFVLLMAFL